MNAAAVAEFLSFSPNLNFTEHFPKPYTKAEARMIKLDENATDETIMEEVVITADDEEEAKDLLPKLRN